MYTIDGRAGLRNHALLVAVRGEGEYVFGQPLRDCLLPIVYFLYVRIAFIITMSTDADRAAAEKAEADKKAAEDAAAATKAAASAWPTGGYNSFIPLLIIFILAVLAVCVCLVRACLDQSQYIINLVNAMLVIYS